MILNTKYLVQKSEGETLALLLERVRRENGLSADIPLTYAGRLDPMAEGLVIILAGEECKKKDQYLGLDKVYEYEVLFGVETDTFDILGLPTSNPALPAGRSQLLTSNKSLNNDFESKVKTIIEKFIGRQTQVYPPYSSKTINGVPLFQLAREGKITELELPKIDIEIYSHEFLGIREISCDELLAQVEQRIKKVVGDFRQQEILDAWHSSQLLTSNSQLVIAFFRISCSSGTYIRRIASDMGHLFGTGAIAWKIKRTKIGDYSTSPRLGEGRVR